METYQQRRYVAWGINTVFVQDNLSYSIKGTLRGLHFQYPHGQTKLIQVIDGEIFDVAVDIRYGSPTFGKHKSVHLSGKNKKQLYIPKGFAHGFCVLSESAFVTYKCSDFYRPESERGVLWCDPELGIKWPLKVPLLSAKDRDYPCLRDLPSEGLPAFGH